MSPPEMATWFEELPFGCASTAFDCLRSGGVRERISSSWCRLQRATSFVETIWLIAFDLSARSAGLISNARCIACAVISTSIVLTHTMNYPYPTQAHHDSQQ